jgi:hypothetical protein
MVFGCDEAVPFHVAPGVFHAKPEFHVNDCGMEPDCAGTGAVLARIFWASGARKNLVWQSPDQSVMGIASNQPELLIPQ